MSRKLRLNRIEIESAAIAAGWVAIVGFDGAPWWRLARVLIVAIAAVALAQASRRASPRRAATTQVAVAAIAMPASATIAIAYATKSGLCVRTIAGMTATGGALAMLIGGISGLVRSARTWRRWLIAIVGLIAELAIVLIVFPAVYSTNVPRPELGAQRPSDRGLSYVDATFETVDGYALSGWYIPSTNRAAVVLLHGASSTRTSVLDQAVVLADHGYGVLMFDARGHGRSAGRAMEFGWYGDRDVAAAVTYLQSRPDVDKTRIAAVGISMGGEEAIGAMAADSRIKATVAEGATNRVYADKSWLADHYGVRGRAQLLIEWLTYQLADLLTAASPPMSLRDAMQAAAPRPVLLIAAGNVEDEQLVGEFLRSAAPDNVTLWIAEGAEHGGALGAQRDEWTRRVTEFLDAAWTVANA